jgi:hypothetical protein
MIMKTKEEEEEEEEERKCVVTSRSRKLMPLGACQDIWSTRSIEARENLAKQSQRLCVDAISRAAVNVFLASKESR